MVQVPYLAAAHAASVCSSLIHASGCSLWEWCQEETPAACACPRCADYTAFHHPQNGVWKIGDVDWAKDPFGFSKTRGGNVPDKYVMGPIAGLELRKPNGQLMTPDEWEGPSSLLSVVIEPYVHELNKDFETGFKKLMSIDKQTMREMLFERYKSETCAETIVTFIETAGSEVTGYFEKAASEVVIDNMDFTSPDGKPTPWYLFEGGTSTLTDAMFDSVRASGANPVKVDHQVRKLAFTEQTKKIIVSGVEAVDGKPLGEGNPFEYQYSHVITTMTNHAFRLVDTTDCRLTVAKKTAIRCLTCTPHRPRILDCSRPFGGRVSFLQCEHCLGRRRPFDQSGPEVQDALLGTGPVSDQGRLIDDRHANQAVRLPKLRHR